MSGRYRSKRKRIWRLSGIAAALALVMAAALAMTGCGGQEAQVQQDGEEPQASQTEVTDVSLVSKINDTMRYATIVATDDQGDVVWSLKTDEFPATELDCFTDIGIYQDQYYYVENGAVVSLELSTGERRWENPDFGGSAGQYCHHIADDGSVYLSGYYGPDFYAVDKNGKTITRIKQVDPLYYWPSEMHVSGDKVEIIMDGSPDGSGGKIYIDMNVIRNGGQTQTSYSNEELVELAKAYYKAENGEEPPVAEVDSENGDEVTIHLYEDMGDHTATWGWYTVNRTTLQGEDLMGNAIDLNTVK